MSLQTPLQETFDPQLLTPENLKLFRYLVVNPNDQLDFINRFWTCKTKQSIALMMYRADRITSLALQFSDLQQYFHIDPIGSLQRIFQHPVDKEDADYVVAKIDNNEFTLEQLYDKHKESPTKMLMRIVLSM